jgi:hypothetical protein
MSSPSARSAQGEEVRCDGIREALYASRARDKCLAGTL